MKPVFCFVFLYTWVSGSKQDQVKRAGSSTQEGCSLTGGPLGPEDPFCPGDPLAP